MNGKILFNNCPKDNLIYLVYPEISRLTIQALNLWCGFFFDDNCNELNWLVVVICWSLSWLLLSHSWIKWDKLVSQKSNSKEKKIITTTPTTLLPAEFPIRKKYKQIRIIDFFSLVVVVVCSNHFYSQNKNEANTIHFVIDVLPLSSSSSSLNFNHSGPV